MLVRAVASCTCPSHLILPHRGPSVAPVQIQIPSVAEPDTSPRCPRQYPRYERVAVNHTVRTISEGFSPGIQSKDQQYAYVEPDDGGVSAAVDQTNTAPPVKAPESHNRYSRPTHVDHMPTPSLKEQCKHHGLTYCCVWDAGNGLIKWVGSNTVPASAHLAPGQTMAIPLEDDARRMALSEYRYLMGTLYQFYQSRVFLLSPRGQFWNNAEPLTYDDSVRDVAVIAQHHDVLVLESEDIWRSIRPFL